MTRYLLSFALLTLALNTTAQTMVKESNGNIMLLSNNVETVISDTKDASSPVLYGQKVYYLRTGINNKITSYDIAGKQYTDVISIGMKTQNGYTIKSEITNMQANTQTGLLYFSTKDTYNGNQYCLTWVYNIASGEYKVFSDGRLDNIDGEGNITVIFEGKDSEGKFMRKARYTAERNLITIGEKEYK